MTVSQIGIVSSPNVRSVFGSIVTSKGAHRVFTVTVSSHALVNIVADSPIAPISILPVDIKNSISSI